MVGHHQRDVLRRVARRVEHLDLGVPHVQDFSVLDAPERVVRLGPGVDHVLRSGGLGELTSARDMIGVHMCVEDVADLHVPLLRLLQITPDVPDGIHDGPDSLGGTSEEVGHGDHGLSIQILTKKHRLLHGFAEVQGGPTATGKPRRVQSGIPSCNRRARNPSFLSVSIARTA